MKYYLKVRSEANKDIYKIALFYEEKSPGLGKDFILCLDATIERIKRNPFIYSKYYKEYHRALLRRFPVGIFLIVLNDLISVVSVMDLRQDPDKIKSSLK